MYKIIDGKQTAADIRKEISEKVKKMVAEGKRPPHLAAILVGNDGSSQTYVANKVKDCEEVGFISTLLKFEDNITEEFLLGKIRELNDNEDVDGFIV